MFHKVKSNANIWQKEDFSFPIVTFPVFEGDVPLAASCDIDIYQLARFVCVISDVLMLMNVIFVLPAFVSYSIKNFVIIN